MRAIDRLLRNRPKAGGLSLLGKIRALFTNGEQGWWYDPSDFNRYIAPLGPELVTNGTFDNNTSGWTAVNSSLASVGGQLVVTNTGAFGSARQLLTTVIGKTYVVEFNIIGGTSPLVRVSQAGSTDATSGTILQFVATQTNPSLQLFCNSATIGATATFDNISVKELTALDTATLFQDSAGTTPVTAMEQPVGLQLDLSKGLVLGPELVADSSFDSAASWTAQNGDWVVSGGKATYTESGTAVVYLESNADISLVGGKWYEVRCTFSGIASGFAIFSVFNKAASVNLFGAYATVSTNGIYVQRIYVASSVTGIRIYGNNNGTAASWSLDNFSIKELPGNHRFQTTSANRPVVSARVNLLTKTEEFNDAAWPKADVTVTANATTAPDGTNTADKLIASATNANHLLNRASLIPVFTGVAYTHLMYAKAGEYSFLRLQFQASGFPTTWANFNLANGTVGLTAGSPNASITPVGNGWYLCSILATATGSSVSGVQPFVLDSDRSDANLAYLGNGTSGIFIWGADFRPTNVGVNLPAYQRVNTSTDYDSTGFPIYIKPNGSNQFMQTNSINFTATDKMTVWQGVRKLSDAASAMVMELSATLASNNGTMYFTAPESGGATRYAYSSKGTVQSTAPVTSGYTAPTTNVLTGTSDIAGDSSILRINGSQQASNTGDQGTGNYGNYPAYFYMRAGTSLPFNGHDYGSIARGAASNAAQITAGETYINSKTKAFV